MKETLNNKDRNKLSPSYQLNMEFERQNPQGKLSEYRKYLQTKIAVVRRCTIMVGHSSAKL